MDVGVGAFEDEKKPNVNDEANHPAPKRRTMDIGIGAFEDEEKPNVNDEADRPAPKRRTMLQGPSSRPNKYEFPKGLMAQHRQKLTRLLRTFYDNDNWTDCAAVLSVLLQLTPERISGYTLMDFRKNFLIAMEILKRYQGAQNYTMKVKQICEIWMSKIKWTSGCAKERQSIQLELVLFLLTQGNFNEAHHITKFLVQDHASSNEPKLHLLHGLISYQIWYSELPVELQLKNSDTLATLHTARSMIFNNDAFKSKDSVECTGYHHASKKEDSSTYCESDSSVDNKKQVFGDKMQHHNTRLQQIHYDSHGANGSSQANEDRNQLSNADKKFREFSIFGPHVHDLDASLLPIRLGLSSEDVEKRIYSHRELLTENYTLAVKHLRAALYSDPPFLPALLPLLQVLLLGDQVGEAIEVLTSFCRISKAALPFRLKARILENFCSNEFVEISTCHETVLRRDPTCSHSIDRLIKMFQDGNYSSINLVDMLVLHLDASNGNCNVWNGFASCLLSIQTSWQSGNQQDQSSANRALHNPSSSSSFPFLKYAEKQSWKLRSRWWSMHHFSKKTFLLEMQAGSWQLMKFKAACASHLYGSSFMYVRDFVDCLRDRKDVETLSFLERHTINPLLIFRTAPVHCNIPVPVFRFGRGPPDPAWAYGTPTNGDKRKPQCNYCGRIIGSAGVTRLKQHLAGGYRHIRMCQQCPENVRYKMRELLRANDGERVKVKNLYNHVYQ